MHCFSVKAFLEYATKSYRMQNSSIKGTEIEQILLVLKTPFLNTENKTRAEWSDLSQ